MAVSPTADRVFRHAAFGGEGAGDAVELSAAGSGNMQTKTLQTGNSGLVWNSLANLVLVFRNENQIFAQPGFRGPEAHSLKKFWKKRCRLHGAGGQIQREELRVPRDSQQAAEGLKTNLTQLGLEKTTDGVGRGQSGVTA